MKVEKKECFAAIAKDQHELATMTSAAKVNLPLCAAQHAGRLKLIVFFSGSW